MLGVSYRFPAKEVTMTKTQRRIEDTSPAMTPGYFGVTFFSGAASKRSRSSLSRRLLFRNGRAIPLSEETD
jgi:hypothetical protein